MKTIKLKRQFLRLEPFGIGTSEVESVPGYFARFCDFNVCPPTKVLRHAEEATGIKLPRQGCGKVISVKPIMEAGHSSKIYNDYLMCVSHITRIPVSRLHLMTNMRFEKLFGMSLTKSRLWWNPGVLANGGDFIQKLKWEITGVYMDGEDFLANRCNCGSTLPKLSLRRSSGKCDKCKAELSEYNSEESPLMEQSKPQSITDPSIRNYLSIYAELVSQLIGIGPEAQSYSFTSAFREIYDGAGFNCYKHAGERVGMNHQSLEKWYQGYKPKLESFIRLLISLELTPFEFFRQQPLAIRFDRCIIKKKIDFPNSRQTSTHSVDVPRVRSLITSDIKRGFYIEANQQEYCLKRLGHPKGSICRHAGDLLSELFAQKRALRHSCSELLRASRISMVEYASRILQDRGESIHHKSIGKLLRYAGFINNDKDSFLLDQWARDLIAAIKDGTHQLPEKLELNDSNNKPRANGCS